MATSDSPLSVPNVTLAVARGASAPDPEPEPQPTDAPAISSVTDNGDGTLSITGSNFGTKTQAAPVLYDTVDVTYENGVADTFVGSLADGDPVPDYEANNSAPYDVMYGGITVNKSDRPRVAGGSCYRLPGREGKIGYPMAYGGRNTPAGNDTLYLAWWFRRKYHWQYWRLAPGDMSGPFTPGEAITINGIDGRYIDYEPETGLHHFEIPKHNANDLSGYVITGLTSGETMTFSTTGGGGFPGTKFARFRDNPDGSGQGGSYTPADYYISPSVPRVYDRLSYSETPPDEWELHEILIQYDFVAGTGTFDAWVNRIHRGTVEQDSINTPDLNYSLTFSLLGNDAYETFQVTDIDFIYEDPHAQRVYLGNASTFSACTHVELQRPTAWADDAVTAAKNEGTLVGDKWVYVVGPGGLVNEQGVQS